MRTCGISTCKNYGKPWDTRHHSMCPYCHGVDDFDWETFYEENDDLIIQHSEGDRGKAQPSYDNPPVVRDDALKPQALHNRAEPAMEVTI